MTFPKKILTLVYILKDNQILLGMKKRGFGKGKWNGFGGKIKVGEETIRDGALREVQEECGLCLKDEDICQLGLIDFEFKNEPVHLEVHVFEARQYSGQVTESDEMAPKWFDIKEMPYDNMWIDDEFWHPWFFKGQKFKAYFLFEGQDKILNHEITPVDSF